VHPESSDDADGSGSGVVHKAYSVPIFQRRYCWRTQQWDPLWHDMTRRQSIKHSLGRLTCTNVRTEEDRSIVIDGQQRFTTVTLILAAIRDEFAELATGSDMSSRKIESRVRLIHEMIFLDTRAMGDWVADSQKNSIVAEGTALEFCRLIPTYCDRASYLAAILPPWAPQSQRFLGETYNPRWHRPLLAKQHFARKIRSTMLSGSASQSQPIYMLQKLLGLLLDGIDILYFPIDIHRGFDDGTEDTQVIYERLAIRDATWCKPRRDTECQSMSAVDLIRNLLLGSFRTTEEKTHFYDTLWLPLERLVQTPCLENGDDDEASREEEGLKAIIRAFVQHEANSKMLPPPKPAAATETKVIGGRIYQEFENWMARDYECWEVSVPDSLAEAHAMDVGRRLLDFARCRIQKNN